MCHKQSTQVEVLWVPVQVTEEIEVEEAYIMDPHGSPGREYRIRMRLTDPTTYPPEAGISFEQVLTRSFIWKDTVCGAVSFPVQLSHNRSCEAPKPSTGRHLLSAGADLHLSADSVSSCSCKVEQYPV